MEKEMSNDRYDEDAPEITHPEARILIDPITGLPVLSAGRGAPVLTSEEVETILFGES
jgi:hypothetical protein